MCDGHVDCANMLFSITGSISSSLTNMIFQIYGETCQLLHNVSMQVLSWVCVFSKFQSYFELTCHETTLCERLQFPN